MFNAQDLPDHPAIRSVSYSTRLREGLSRMIVDTLASYSESAVALQRVGSGRSNFRSTSAKDTDGWVGERTGCIQRTAPLKET